MNPLGPLGFRFDPDELMTLRNHCEGIQTDRAIPMAWLIRPQFNDTGWMMEFITLFDPFE
jgi:hypothetical protein